MSKLVLVRSPYHVFWPRTLGRQAREYITTGEEPLPGFWPRYPSAWAYSLSLTSLPSVEELILLVLLVVNCMKISSSTEGKLVRDKF